MNPEIISSSLADFMQALSLKNDQPVNWSMFLTKIMDYTQACEGHLTITDQSQKARLIEITTSAQSGSECLKWPLGIEGNSLTLMFSDESQKSHAEDFWLQIDQQVKQIFQLGWQWQEKINLHQIVKSCSQKMNVSQLSLNSKGGLSHHSVLPKYLIEDEVLVWAGDRIQFKGDPSWLTKNQKALMAGDAQEGMQYQTLHYGDNALQCLLIYKRDVKLGWQTQAHHFTLIFCKNAIQPASSWLKSRFDLSEAEASVASWFSTGLSAEGVADKTGYTTHTVYSYIKKLYAILGINKQSQLTAAVWPELPF
jgi:DNA-binding CsgD family transcriptional regulator